MNLKSLILIIALLGFLVTVWWTVYNLQRNLREGQWTGFIERANQAVARKDYASARKLYSKAVKINPNLPGSAQASLGEIYFYAGDIAKAQEKFEEALKRNPDLDSAQTLLTAIKLSQETLNSDQSIHQKARVAYEFLQREQPFLSLPILEKITQENSKYRDGHYLLAASYLKTGAVAKALTEIEKTLRIDPNFKAAGELKKEIEEIRERL